MEQENRKIFEKKIEQNEYQKIEGKIIPEINTRESREFFSDWHIFRSNDRLYRIISTQEETIVFQEMNFPNSKLFQTSQIKFRELIKNETLKKNIFKNIEIGDVYILARTKFTYEILSIDRNAMVIRRFFKNELKICKNYGLYSFWKDVENGKYILIKVKKNNAQHRI